MVTTTFSDLLIKGNIRVLPRTQIMLERQIIHYYHIITHLRIHLDMQVGIMGIMECLTIPLLPLKEEVLDNPGF